MPSIERSHASKVPQVTALFWLIKIIATTLGETAGDTVSMTMDLGYLAGTAIFGAAFLLFVAMQIRAKSYHPALYWLTIVASTTMGTTLADFCTRSLGIGYPGGSTLLLVAVVLSLWAWHRGMGTISVETVTTPRAEMFYWTVITFSQTLGTALGDWVAESNPYEFGGAAILFGAMLLVILALYLFTSVNRVMLFWAAFILTRPLGAAVGDYLDKPLDEGGMAFSRPQASAVLALAMLLLVGIGIWTEWRRAPRQG